MEMWNYFCGQQSIPDHLWPFGSISFIDCRQGKGKLNLKIFLVSFQNLPGVDLGSSVGDSGIVVVVVVVVVVVEDPSKESISMWI